jgi:ubiquinone/menaquinone biosynthesis C-methylase UbiE
MSIAPGVCVLLQGIRGFALGLSDGFSALHPGSPRRAYDRAVSDHKRLEPSGSPVYALGSDPAERDRLRRQSEDLRAHSAALLDRAGLEEGWSVIDLGCGPSGIIELLSSRVGPMGHVVGLEFDPANVIAAREFARERGLMNVEVIEGDARHTGLAAGSFDLAHARTLLINVPKPDGIVAEMVRLVKPGGSIAILEPDVGISLCYPPLPAWDRMSEIFRSTYAIDGADPLIGRRLAQLLREAGLVEVDVVARADLYGMDNSRRTSRPDLVPSMRPKIVQRGLVTDQVLEEIDHAVRRHLDDPNTLVMPSLLFLAWGRKPAA